eukprot:GGOE01036284.1.p1 GENE.GGOE01036284.1~~GGOE01036284.1.p1  ORF type:complete len:291 (-),score=103.68 GGOE01036284.1:265-1113(-)
MAHLEGGYAIPDNPAAPFPSYASMPGPEPNEPCTLQRFLALNPDLGEIKKKRNSFIGWMRYVLAAIFTFLLLSPVLAFIPTVGDQGWVLALVWVVFSLILMYYIEFWHRAELWYVCICRGLILDFKDTHEIKQWALHIVMITAFAFIAIYGIVVGISKDGALWDQVVTGVLAAIGLVFIFKVCKSIITLEVANHLLTINMLITYLEDPQLLEAQGFRVIHQTQLVRWFMEHKEARGEIGFSWNQLFSLGHEAVPPPKNSNKMRYIWGFCISNYLKKFKDLDA